MLDIRKFSEGKNKEFFNGSWLNLNVIFKALCLLFLIMVSVVPAGALNSGYVKDYVGSVVYNANVTVYNSTYSATAYTDLSGYYSLNIYADGTYSYSVSKKGYVTNSSSQSFTNGAANVNFTLNGSVGRIYGTVFTYVNLTAPLPRALDLVALKGQYEESTVGVGGTQTLGKVDGKNYVIKFNDVDCDGRQASISILEDGTEVHTGVVDQNGYAEFKVYEDLTVQTYITISAGAMQCGSEVQIIKLKSGIDNRKKSWVSTVDFLSWIVGRMSSGDFGSVMQLAFLQYWADFGPTYTGSDGVVFNASGNTMSIAKASVDYSSETNINNFKIVIDAESLTSSAAKIGFGYTDDDAPEAGDGDYNDYWINDRKKQGLDTVDFMSLDADGDKKINIYVRFYGGYSNLKLYNIYVDPRGAPGTSAYLLGATVYYNTTTKTVSDSPNAFYQLWVPLGNDTVYFSKPGYENKNVTHWFNLSYPEYEYDIFLNSTNKTVNLTEHFIYVDPNPVIIGGAQAYAYYRTKDFYSYEVSVCEYNQLGNCYSTDDLNANTESTYALSPLDIGPYSIYITAIKSILWPFREIIVGNAFTVESNVPSLRWSSDKYFLNDTMRLEVHVPTGSQVVRVYYPNASLMYNNSFSAGSSNATWNTVSGSLRMDPGVYSAEISGNNKKWLTELMNIERDNFTLDVPASVKFGNYLKIKYQAPKTAYLYVVDSENNIISNDQVQGINTKSIYTGNLSEKNNVITVRLIKDGVIKAEAKTNVFAGIGGYGEGEEEGDLMYSVKQFIYGFVGNSPSTLFVIGMAIIAICAALMFAIIKHPLGGAFGGLMGLGIATTMSFIPMVWAVVVVILAGLSFMGMMKKA